MAARTASSGAGLGTPRGGVMGGNVAAGSASIRLTASAQRKNNR